MQKYEYKNIDEKYVKESEEKASAVEPFTHGIRVLMIIQRHRDGGDTCNSKLRMYITRNKEEWIKAYAKLLQERDQYPDIALRIYQTLNSRNIKKGIRKFKESQLEADYYDDTLHQNFYIDIKNRLVSSIMSPSCKEQNYFLFDIDTKDNELINNIVDQICEVTVVKYCYETKNGMHFITEPFNPALFNGRYNMVEIKKDAMMLLKY